MTPDPFYEPCRTCETKGSLFDDDAGRVVVCGACLGRGFHDVNPPPRSWPEQIPEPQDEPPEVIAARIDRDRRPDDA